MTYKQIETMRQIRLFITQVVIPTGVGLIAIDKMHPEWKYKIADKAKGTKENINGKFKVVKDDCTGTTC